VNSDFSGKFAVVDLNLNSSQQVSNQNQTTVKASIEKFLLKLRHSITTSFQLRIKILKDELRRMDRMDAPVNMTDYFLVKESLAISYEQMMLRGEALAIYEELSSSLSSSVSSSQNPSLTPIFTYDTPLFRSNLRQNVTPPSSSSHELLQYLFSRESNFLFLLQRPADVVLRAFRFILLAYKSKITQNSSASASASARLETEAWALTSCYDVQSKVTDYFAQLALKQRSKKSGDNAVAVGEEQSKASQILSELLEVSERSDCERRVRSDCGRSNPTTPYTCRVSLVQ